MSFFLEKTTSNEKVVAQKKNPLGLKTQNKKTEKVMLFMIRQLEISYNIYSIILECEAKTASCRR